MMGGVAVENQLGIVERAIPAPAGDETEFRTVSEFVAVQQFGTAPEFILNDLVTDALPIATEVRSRIGEGVLDANDLDETLAQMLLDIAGQPETPKDVFMLQAVYGCAMLGAEYGRFLVLREGVTDSGEVNEIVTRYTTTSLDGFLDFLADLPEPAPPEESEGDDGDAKGQLDEWAGDMEPETAP